MANMSRTIFATIVFALLVAYPTNADELASHQEKVKNESQLTILQKRSKHFVLVHGACHGAWSWYKLIPLLQKAGHNVTSIDLGASGRRPENLTDLNGFPDYVQPLVDVMEGLPASEKVILVGHSFGGLPIAWVTELYPKKIFASVYLAAFMPDTVNKAFYPIQQYFASLPSGYYVDSEINNNFPVPRLNFTLLFGPIDLRTKGYQKSPEEDLNLALTLVRTTSLFQQDLSNTTFTRAKYGEIPRIYIVSTKDLLLQTSYQRYFASLPTGYYVDSEIDNNFPVPRLNFTLLLGPIDLRTKGYQKSPDEDVALALTLIRTTSLFQQDLSNTTFTQAKYGSVPRIYVVSTQDLLIQTSYQRVMIQNFPPREVKEINTDHSPMASSPLRLLSHLLDIANRY